MLINLIHVASPAAHPHAEIQFIHLNYWYDVNQSLIGDHFNNWTQQDLNLAPLRAYSGLSKGNSLRLHQNK